VESPPVQFARTVDGLNIAYTDAGDGEPLVLLPLGPYGHQQMLWDIQEYREWLLAIGRGRRLIAYDGRGAGQSSRPVDHSTFEDWLSDLDAVVSRLDVGAPRSRRVLVAARPVPGEDRSRRKPGHGHTG
jgi:pimeloyl-ACP methyl ester carboxylesterase